MTLFEALTGGAFDRLNWQHSGEFDQKFSKKSNDRGFAGGGKGDFGIDRYIKAKHSWFPFTIWTNPVPLKLNYCCYKLLPFLVLNFLAAPSHVT